MSHTSKYKMYDLIYYLILAQAKIVWTEIIYLFIEIDNQNSHFSSNVQIMTIEITFWHKPWNHETLVYHFVGVLSKSI